MSEVRFTDQHEWIRLDGDEATVGITKYAAESLGDVVFVELPASGKVVRRRRSRGGGKRQGRQRNLCPGRRQSHRANSALEKEPSKVNEDPEGEGWFFKLKLSDKAEFAKLMDAAAYAKFVESL